MDEATSRLQECMAQVINDVLDQNLAPNNQLVTALREMVEASVRADERAKVLAEVEQRIAGYDFVHVIETYDGDEVGMIPQAEVLKVIAKLRGALP